MRAESCLGREGSSQGEAGPGSPTPLLWVQTPFVQNTEGPAQEGWLMVCGGAGGAGGREAACLQEHLVLSPKLSLNTQEVVAKCYLNNTHSSLSRGDGTSSTAR